MELRHLRYFLAAAEEEHFGRASDRLHVTRPAVSQIIADLEGELGTPLFERLSHSVRLTAAGRTFLSKLHAVMDDLDEAVTLTKRVGQGRSGVLSIGYGSLTLLHPLFRAAIKRYREIYPEVTLSLYEMPTYEHLNALGEGKIHAGFMHFGPKPLLRTGRSNGSGARDEAVLDKLLIQTGGLGVVVPSDHRLAGRKSVTLDELAGEAFVIVPRSSSSPDYGVLYGLCQQAGFAPQVVQEVNTVLSQLNLVSVGMGICLAVIGRNFTYPSSLSVVPLHQVDYVTSFVLGWVRGQREPALDRMIEIVQALANAQ